MWTQNTAISFEPDLADKNCGCQVVICASKTSRITGRFAGQRLRLGADLYLCGGIINERGTLDARGHNVTIGGTWQLGAGLGGTVTRGSNGVVDVGGNLDVNNNAAFPCQAGDLVRGNAEIDGVINVTQMAGDTTGLTIDGTIAFANAGDRIDLSFDDQLAGGLDWGLAWQGNHTNELHTWYDTER